MLLFSVSVRLADHSSVDLRVLLFEVHFLLVEIQVLQVVVLERETRRSAALRETELRHDILPEFVVGHVVESAPGDDCLEESAQVQLSASDQRDLAQSVALLVHELEDSSNELLFFLHCFAHL